MTLPAEVAAVLADDRRWCVVNGDSADVLRSIPDNTFDALCCDPPAGISFMGKGWDDDKGGRDQWIAWLAEIMREAMRVVKPGGHGLVWALPRTSYWTALALDDAGWEVRDRVSHIFSTGFPKSLDLSKAADKVAGIWRGRAGAVKSDNGSLSAPNYERTDKGDPVTAAAAAALQGWGSATKPAMEDWWLVRKPFKGSLINNVLTHGTGGLNIDGCRVPHASAADLEQHAAGVAAIKARGGSMQDSWKNSSDLSGANDVTTAGRWPAHLLLSHGESCRKVGKKKVKAAPSWNDNRGPSMFTGAETSPVHHAANDGTETVDEWECAEGCAVAELNRQRMGDARRRHRSSVRRHRRCRAVL